MHKKYNLIDFHERNIPFFLITELKSSIKQNLLSQKKKDELFKSKTIQIFAWFFNDHSSFL